MQSNPPSSVLSLEDIDDFELPSTIHLFDTSANGGIATYFNMGSWVGLDMKGFSGYKDLIPA